MELEALKNLELDKICRCCLTVKKEMRPLFCDAIVQMLSDCTMIQVEKTDGWPDQICVQCVKQVSRFHSFRHRLVKLDKQLREYIKGLTVVVEEPVQLSQELALTKIGLTQGQQFIARTANGHQVINGTPLMAATTAFAQPVQLPTNTQLVHHNGQLIPVQMVPGSQGQVAVQIRSAANDNNCDLIVQPRAVPPLTGPNTITAASVDTDDHMEHHQQQYYEETIETSSAHDQSKETIEILHEEEVEDEDEMEIEDEECGEDYEGERTNCLVEDIPESEYELEEHEDEEEEEAEQQNISTDLDIEIYVEPDEVGAEVVEPQLPASTSPTTSSRMMVRRCNNHVQMPVSMSDSEEDPEFMAEFISLQTSCPEPGRHVCNLCHLEFKMSKWLHKHMKCHSNWFKANCKKRPECEICHKQFKGPGMLKMHMKTHEERVFKCQFCMKSFQNEHHLNVHVAKHNQISPTLFKCEPCDRTFVSANDLRVHKRTHRKVDKPPSGSKQSEGVEKESRWMAGNRQRV